MIRMKVIEVASRVAASSSPGYQSSKNEEIAKVEEFIAQIGYDNIKNIVVSAPNTQNLSYYSIFYEDGLPYTPRTMPKKKGIFG